ncbi:NAD-dependent epimerase/dehydratase family protein [Guggenheimella bovis]
MKEIIVIGGAGFLGSELVRQIAQRGDRPIVFSNHPSPYLEVLGVPVFVGDTRNKESLRDCISKYEKPEVIHCASIITIEKKPVDELFDVNVTGLRNTIEVCQELNTGRLVYVSSVHAIPMRRLGLVKREIREFDEDRVIGQYAKSKAKASRYAIQAMDAGMDMVMVHPSGIVGVAPLGEGMTTPMIRDYLLGKLKVLVGGGHDFVDVKDVAEGTLSALDKGKRGENYILSGDYHSAKDILDEVSRLAGKKPIGAVMPMGIFKIVAPVVEWGAETFRKKPPLTSYMATTLSSFELYSHNKASKELGYRTRAIEETLTELIEAIRNEASF